MAADPVSGPRTVAHVDLFTGGQCTGMTGVGGWVAILRSGEHYKEIGGRDEATTSNRIELTAVVEGLSAILKPSTVVVHCPSHYVRESVEHRLRKWKSDGWKGPAGAPLPNVILWKKIDDLQEIHDVVWLWTRGHADQPEVERAGMLAAKRMRDEIRDRRTGTPPVSRQP